jgi:predicted flap endonuclease-1-like 5' DNA nuclease
MASEDRAVVQIPAAGLMLSALLTGMNLAVRRAPAGDWWVPLGLAVVGFGLVWVTRPRPERPSAIESSPQPTRTYTITRASGVQIDQPSPETPDKIDPQPAPVPGHTARTEYAEQDAGARIEGDTTNGPEPGPDKGEEARPETEPVLDKTAAPQMPYEAERTGILTPEAVSDAVETPNPAEQTAGTGPVEQADPAVAAQVQASNVPPPDDLLIIHGIGPKINAALVSAGIRTYADLAAADEQRLLDILTTANVRFIDKPSFWIAQAGYAARGDMDGLRRYIAEHRPTGTGDE